MASDSYDLVRDGISGGGLELGSTLSSLDVLLTQGRITADEYASLVDLAGEHCDPQLSLPPELDRISALELKVATIEKRVAAIEGASDHGGAAAQDEWPAFVQPTGAHNVYPKGAKVTFEGARYVSLIDANVWDPREYPRGWQKASDGGQSSVGGDTTSTGGAGAPTTSDEWPAFVQPTGASDVYAKGARVTFDGARYTSLVDNNGWSPSAYPAGWQKEA